ncbi:MAG: OmpA family protein [Chitinophagaceae bacterium]|nr:OmpA family protein [Chitinophagaceae bacterium]
MKKLLLPALLLIFMTGHAQNNNSFAVHFDLDKFNLTTDAATSLDSFVAAKKTDVKIKLYGHTDIMAGYEYNDALSLKRTHAVKNYLVSKGFSADNIIEEKGFGKRRPLNRNHGEIEMYMNRRVEIVVEGEAAASEEINNEQIKVEAAKSLTEQIKDTQTTVGSSIVLKNMNFYGGTHVIIPESMPVLMELVEIMKKNPSLEIAVEGHICCQEGTADGFDIGTRTVNLSENRAREICLYLSKNGIASARLKYKGFGHQFPLTPYPEKTEEERKNNRRVEIKILKK